MFNSDISLSSFERYIFDGYANITLSRNAVKGERSEVLGWLSKVLRSKVKKFFQNFGRRRSQNFEKNFCGTLRGQSSMIEHSWKKYSKGANEAVLDML